MRNKLKRLLAILMAMVICMTSVDMSVYASEANWSAQPQSVVSSGETTQNDWDGVTTEKTYELTNCQVTFSLTSYWEGGYNANVKILNTSEQAIENWYLCCDLDNEISNIWNAEINSHENGVYVIKNAG